ncbi:cytochrome P450 [Streptomyces formicae]|uniref:Putative cytochrome P450 hydroxylase n=1 Tax=Streptomyces formicae TaxID=1616117 RepID=A0A291QII8_9ACTN|nr:cytochrome P450 [Streptomyces formicae]ATL31326.1 putative cytochrome P450 hydroxylase [Streptomyces formicae]
MARPPAEAPAPGPHAASSADVEIPTLTVPVTTSPDVARDPYPLYRVLRERRPLVRDEGTGAWLVSRYRDVCAALARPRLVAPPPGRGLAHMEGPTHLAHRALVSSALRGRALAALAAGVSRTAYVLARRIAARQEADLVAEFCQWLPTAAAVAALGLPYEDAARVQELCRGGLAHLGGAHHRDLEACLRPHLARRRAHPGHDLLSVLCTAEIDGRPLSDETVMGVAGTLLGGGGEAAALALGSFLANLLDHPGQLALIRERPELIPGAWAESLRRDPAAHVVLRRAARPVTVAGVPLPAGAVVACLVGSAGRDPARFADPDRYDIFRADPGRVAFGAGRHACPGAELAALTAEHGLRALLDALPGLRWAPGFRPAPEGLLTRGPRTLLVRHG